MPADQTKKWTFPVKKWAIRIFYRGSTTLKPFFLDKKPLDNSLISMGVISKDESTLKEEKKV